MLFHWDVDSTGRQWKSQLSLFTNKKDLFKLFRMLTLPKGQFIWCILQNNSLSFDEVNLKED